MNTKIGAYEAKTKLPKLLRQVKEGKRFTITIRGKAIADLVPSESVKPIDKSAAVERFKAFMRENPMPRVRNLKKVFEEGRQ